MTRTSNMANENAQDEIQIEREVISLRCPISHSRIQAPVKFSACTHRQCFDVDSWSTLVESSEIIRCPVCRRVYNSGDLINDWFFDSILRQTPDTVSEVVVGEDNQWYSKDGNYSSAGSSVLRGPGSSSRVRKDVIEIGSDDSGIEVLSSNVDKNPSSSPNRADKIVKLEAEVADSKCTHQ